MSEAKAVHDLARARLNQAGIKAEITVEIRADGSCRVEFLTGDVRYSVVHAKEQFARRGPDWGRIDAMIFEDVLADPSVHGFGDRIGDRVSTDNREPS